MTKRRADAMTKEQAPGPASPELDLDTLFMKTAASPLLACGQVRKRTRLEGVSERGPWTMIRVEISGLDGRTVSVVVPDLNSVPEKGKMVCLPVYVAANGHLREARQNGQEV